MTKGKHKGGRPTLTEAQKSQRKIDLLQRIEPFLKSGLSVNKALREAKIANSEFYIYLQEDELFGEKIQQFKQYISVLLNSTLVRHLLFIVEKQRGNIHTGITPQTLSESDIKFLKWFALNSNFCQEEYGSKENRELFDPATEIQKITKLIDEVTINVPHHILHN